VTRLVKRYAWNNNEIQILDYSQSIPPWLQHTKSPKGQLRQTQYFNKFKVIIFDSWVNQSFADFQSPRGNNLCQHLIMNGAIQCQTLCAVK
jgi:hypothetical protein